MAKLCTCGHVHPPNVRCGRLVSGVSAGGGGPTYCGCSKWHDAEAGAPPPFAPPQPDQPL